MSEELKSSSTSIKASSTVGIPTAIVIAGGLIAAAMYFGGDRASGTTANNNAGPIIADEAQPPAPPADNGQVAGVVVGEIRPLGNNDHVKGAANGKVTIVEYSDIECPFCKSFHPTMQQLVDEYPNDVRWVYRHFPLEQLHPNARIAALATECAAEQGKFWETLDYMFTKTSTSAELAEDKLLAIAQSAGVINSTQFSSCMTSKKYNQKIEDDIADAAVAGGRGTPHSVIVGPNGEREALSGAQPYAAVKAAVEKYL